PDRTRRATAKAPTAHSVRAVRGRCFACRTIDAMHANTERVQAALHAANITGETRKFDKGVNTAAKAAASLGCEVGAIANSLIFTADDEVILVMTSGAHRIDTDFFADRIGVGHVGRASADQVRAATGQPIGGVAPTGHPG